MFLESATVSGMEDLLVLLVQTLTKWLDVSLEEELQSMLACGGR